MDITYEDRQLLLTACQDSEADKIVITHGTDTIIETGKFLHGLSGKTIVLTGAITPEPFRDTDADFNVGAAVAAVAVLHPGVYIAMNGRVLTCDEAIFDVERNQFVSKSDR